MRYLLISRQNIADIEKAGQDLLTILPDDDDTVVVENSVRHLVRQVKAGKSFKVRAIKNDTIFVVNGTQHNLEYEEDKQRIGSIFIFLVETLNKWKILPGNKSWQFYDEKVYSKLEKLLNKSTL